MHLVLASASPRRRDLLEAAGLVCIVDPVDIDETQRLGEPPSEYVERLAVEKATAVAARHRGRLVVGADTAVVVDGVVFGKPLDAADAERMLRALSGRAHDVLTGFALIGPTGRVSGVEQTTVWFTRMREAEIASYVASGEPYGKAGAYAIQGLASKYVPRIAGSYTNVVGLPVAAVADAITRLRARR